MYFVYFCLLLQFTFSEVIIPFYFRSKQTNNDLNEDEKYFDTYLHNDLFTKLIVDNKEIMFRLTMNRYPMYINKNSYSKISHKASRVPSNNSQFYSLNNIGIDLATFENSSVCLNQNSVEDMIFTRLNYFVPQKISDANIGKYSEIGFNIGKADDKIPEIIWDERSQEEIEEDFEIEKQREEEYKRYFEELEKERGRKEEENKRMKPMGEDEYGRYGEEEEEEEKKGEEKERKEGKEGKEEKEEKKEKKIIVRDGKVKEEEANFIYQLKKKRLIDSYSFTLEYDLTNNLETGQIKIGALPHELDQKNYNISYYFYDHSFLENKPPYSWGFKYRELLYGKDAIESVSINKKVTFSFDNGFIVAPREFREFLSKEFFLNHLSDCKYGEINNLTYYFCKSKKSIKNFKSITFRLSSAFTMVNRNDTKFEFDYKDLFKKDSRKGVYYFQILFNNTQNSGWIFGKPLFKKYKMVFDQDKKIYGFYTNYIYGKNTVKNPSFFPLLLGIITFSVIISLSISYVLYKKLIKIPRKNKANELDDTFDYDFNADYKKSTDILEGRNEGRSKNIEMKNSLII